MKSPREFSIAPLRAYARASREAYESALTELVEIPSVSVEPERRADVRVAAEHALEAYEGRSTGPEADAIRTAMHFAFGRVPVFVREGGSIGAVLSMERVLHAPVLFLGLSLPEHGYHAPNENFDWRQAIGGMVAFAKYFEQLATLAKPRRR